MPFALVLSARAIERTNIHENHDLHTGIIKKQGLQPCLPSLPCAYSHNYYNFGVSKN